MRNEVSDALTPDFLADFCQRYQIEELAVFGSALREDFRPDSDVDFLVTYTPDKRHAGWYSFPDQDEIEARIGRKTDWLTRRSVERSRNPFFRREVLRNLEVLYAAPEKTAV